MSGTLKIVVVSLLFHAGACASATLVRRDAGGGRVQLSGSTVPAISQAKVLMAEQCDGHFQAIERAQELDFECRDEESALDDAIAGL